MPTGLIRLLFASVATGIILSATFVSPAAHAQESTAEYEQRVVQHFRSVNATNRCPPLLPGDVWKVIHNADPIPGRPGYYLVENVILTPLTGTVSYVNRDGVTIRPGDLQEAFHGSFEWDVSTLLRTVEQCYPLPPAPQRPVPTAPPTAAPVVPTPTVQATPTVAATPTKAPTITPTPTPTPVVPFQLKVDGGWKGVAADGKSEINLVAELPPGVAAEKADFKITKITAHGAAAKSDAGGTLATKPIENGQATAVYAPPSHISEPFELTIEASVTDSNGKSYTDSVKLYIVQPPVVLVHGVWSNPSAFDELLPMLKASGFKHLRRFSYADRNSGDPVEIAMSLEAFLALDARGYVPQSAADGIMASRYDLVGHSLGGLIIRQYVSQGQNFERVRKVVTLGTPHLGSAFGTWFLYFEKSKSAEDKVKNAPYEVRNHPNWKDGYRSWTYEYFEWLKDQARSSDKPPMDASFFKYGAAVEALAVGSPFLMQLNSDASRAHADKIDYYFLYGQNPLIPIENKDGWMKWLANSTSWPSNNVMIDTFFDHVTKPNTDGVVPAGSATGTGFKLDDGTVVTGLPFRPKAMRAVSANHNNITKAAASLVSLALKGYMDGPFTTYTYGTLQSPAHLHAYDSQGRHVGLDTQGNVELGIPGASFSGPEAETGAPETIVVPGTEQIRFEVKGYQEGSFGLTVRRSTGDSDREVSFKNVPIKPGQTASVKLVSGSYQDMDTASGKVLPQATITRSVEAESDGTGALILVAVLLLLVGGAAALLLRARRRRPVAGAGGPSAAMPGPALARAEATAVARGAASTARGSADGSVPRFCGQCGRPLPPAARFCAGCGAAAGAQIPPGSTAR